MTQVLVADDSPTVRLMLRSWLEPAGYAVLEAADGPRALETLRTHAEPLIVLLDYQMPGMTGDQVLRAALADRLTPPRRVYAIISGEQSTFPPEFVDLLRELGIQLIPKPFDRDALLMLMDYLSARQAASA
jgi:CheY-like chemotaxis protein